MSNVMNEFPDCPVETAAMVMADKWKILIVGELLEGTRRFGELKKALPGISQKVLTQHLRIMETNGLVDRRVYAQVPPKVEYSLTPIGQELQRIHAAMAQWGIAYKKQIVAK